MDRAANPRSRTGRRLAAVIAPIVAGVLIAAPPAGATPSPGTYIGAGFDACSAPASQTMQAWLDSPYRAVGVYFGGVNRGCTQPNLTPAWVAEQIARGWHLIPLYVGLQAPCTTSNKQFRIDPANAAAQGRAQADDAVAAARALGLDRDSVLVFDMEAYLTTDAACRGAVLAFMSGWTARLHDLSYLSGFYSSMASGVADQVAAYATPGYVRPDYLDFARWDGVATVSDAAIPAAYWSPHRRIKQYLGGHNETHGGVTINIDNDFLDVAPLPTTGFGDFTGNGWSDVMARRTTTGQLWVYPGNGVSLGTRILVGGSGWNAMNAIVRMGDFDRQGGEDVIARESATGALWLYPGTGTGLGPRTLIGSGWTSMREITPIGDMTGDGYPDLLAVSSSSGALYLYPGRGNRFGTRSVVGSSGWNAMSQLNGGGDYTDDGRPDLIARQTSTGNLYLYAGRSGGFAPRVLIGTGWGNTRDLTQVGDLNRDGYPDLTAISRGATLYVYPGRFGGLGSRWVIGTSWGDMAPTA